MVGNNYWGMVGGVITGFSGLEVSLGVVISHSIGVGVGGNLISIDLRGMVGNNYMGMIRGNNWGMVGGNNWGMIGRHNWGMVGGNNGGMIRSRGILSSWGSSGKGQNSGENKYLHVVLLNV